MPLPSVDPMPSCRHGACVVPLEAQDASYLAASDRIASLRVRTSWTIRSCYVLIFIACNAAISASPSRRCERSVQNCASMNSCCTGFAAYRASTMLAPDINRLREADHGARTHRHAPSDRRHRQRARKPAVLHPGLGLAAGQAHRQSGRHHRLPPVLRRRQSLARLRHHLLSIGQPRPNSAAPIRSCGPPFASKAKPALSWWKEHLEANGVATSEIAERAGHMSLDFEDPEGQRLRLVNDTRAGGAHPWDKSPVPARAPDQGPGPDHHERARPRAHRTGADERDEHAQGPHPSRDRHARAKSMSLPWAPAAHRPNCMSRSSPTCPLPARAPAAVHHVAFRTPGQIPVRPMGGAHRPGRPAHIGRSRALLFHLALFPRAQRHPVRDRDRRTRDLMWTSRWKRWAKILRCHRFSSPSGHRSRPI